MPSAQTSAVRVEKADGSAERGDDASLNPELARRFLLTTPTGQLVRCDIDRPVGGTFAIVDRRAGENCGATCDVQTRSSSTGGCWS